LLVGGGRGSEPGPVAAVPSEQRPEFDKLVGGNNQQLSGVKEYKVRDEPEKAVYVVGRTPDGRWAGWTWRTFLFPPAFGRQEGVRVPQCPWRRLLDNG
jgi:hypothetical protein